MSFAHQIVATACTKGETSKADALSTFDKEANRTNSEKETC
jgi:hypothetical protein